MDVSPAEFNVREMHAGAISQLRVAGLWEVCSSQTVDIDGTLTGLVGETRTLRDARVWVYTDALGRPVLYPLPAKDPFGCITMDWPWKQELRNGCPPNGAEDNGTPH